MKRLAVLITHPIQYYAPVFKLLAQKCKLKVFYTWGDKSIIAKHDPGFGKLIKWDIPLLDGYEYEFLENTAKNPGSHHRKGIINPAINNRIAAFKPSAILIYGYAYVSHFKVMRHFKGKIPIYFRGDSTLLDKSSPLKSLLKMTYLTWVYHYVDFAFYVGSGNKKYFLKYGLNENQLIFAPHAIDNDRFAEDRKDESMALRRQLGIKDGDYLILYAGKFEEKKNPNFLLDAFILLNNPNTHLLFVGNGKLENDLKTKCNTTSLRTQISFLDFQNQSQMPIIYQACDIFCLPSKGPGETWGLAVNEAMACGKAVLVSDKVGCAEDLVKDSLNGFIFKSDDLNDLLLKLKLLIETQDLNKMGFRSLEIIKKWTIKKQIQAFSKLLNN
jgi:glycosyltransferase involved in cell wall biosynthesis